MVNAIPQKAAYGPDVEECLRPKRQNKRQNEIKWHFERESDVRKPAYHR
jgi:hypothetical protein